MDFDIEWIKEYFTIENMIEMLGEYRALGPLPGILLPMIEAFLPIFPLVLFVMANAAAFGLWKGFILSWTGAVLGATLVFLIIRKLGQQRFFRFIRKHPQVQKLMNWVERHGFGPLFLLLCFPFSPSAIINVVAGLSRISIYQFLLAVMLGKVVMIFTISYIGYDIMSWIRNPAKSIIILISITLLWLVGKRIEKRLQRNVKSRADHSS
ncbi:TVP38/TMEM64 family protein [Bacillus marinisedimentorum]|uniref:TVP38/TMEM64 family protein n=1 Tax=Bacillus marinisedimentorum TaxID=1821260 RepID=UPI0008724A61|nr:TVP38/TMEM64 family protein [Bacillus marinisedimentorum]